jgi:quinol monooxygenase YgiN
VYFHKNLHFTVSRARVQPGKEQEYLDFRKNEILPQMCAWPGCVFSLLLKDNKEANAWLIVNAWQSREDLVKWQADEAEVKLRKKALTILAGPLESVGEFTEFHL